MISLCGESDSASITDGRYFSSRSRPFQLGITTLAARVSGAVSAGTFLRGVSQHTRSHRSSAKAASSQQNRREQRERQAPEQSPGARQETLHSVASLASRFLDLRSESQLAAQFQPSGLADHGELGRSFLELRVQGVAPSRYVRPPWPRRDPASARPPRAGRSRCSRSAVRRCSVSSAHSVLRRFSSIQLGDDLKRAGSARTRTAFADRMVAESRSVVWSSQVADLREFLLQQADVFLAFPQEIGGARGVEKSWKAAEAARRSKCR